MPEEFKPGCQRPPIKKAAPAAAMLSSAVRENVLCCLSRQACAGVYRLWLLSGQIYEF